MSTHLPYDAPGQTVSVFPIPLTVPESAALRRVPVGAPKSIPLWVPEAYRRPESAVLPNCWVILTESSGHLSTPEPAEGRLDGSMANLSSDSNCRSSCSNAFRFATFCASIFLYSVSLFLVVVRSALFAFLFCASSAFLSARSLFKDTSFFL